MASTKMVFYDEGPLQIAFGEVGKFQIGVPKEIPLHIANVLIRKGQVKEFVEPISSKKKGKEE